MLVNTAQALAENNQMQMIVATVGSIAKAPIYWATFCVVSSMKRTVPDGAGQYRQFPNDLARYCVPRGWLHRKRRSRNGVW